MRILFTSSILEHPAAGGPQLRIENSIKALARVGELDIISRATPLNDKTLRETQQFFETQCREFAVPARLTRTRSGNRYVRKLQSGWRRLAGADTAEDARFILDHVDRRRIDIVWFGYGNISFSLIRRLKTLRPSIKVVCDTDSVWSRFVLRELPFAEGIRRARILRSGRRKQAEEVASTSLCDVTTAVSEVDAEYYRSIAPDPSRVHVFANAIDLETYKYRPAAPVGFKRPAILLAGSYGHHHTPMNTAGRWIVDEVLPTVRRAVPGTHLYLVGRKSDVGFGHLKDPGVTATGLVRSVLPFLCNTDVALVPLQFESGTRFKILEAGACKVPIVSTTLGAEGLPVVDGRDILLADDAEGFARAIIRVLQDPLLGTTLANNCHRLVAERFSIETLADQARGIIDYLISAHPRSS